MATTHVLDVPGARLHYEVRGAGPLLLITGAPMDAKNFAPLADALAAHHTVVTHDPRGISRSKIDELLSTQPVEFPGDHAGFMGTPEEFADTLRRTLA